jgi:peroxiredoxin family protein
MADKRLLHKKYPNKKRYALEAVLAAAGIALSADIIAYLTMDALNNFRRMQSEAIQQAAPEALVEWHTEGDEGVCEFCQMMADDSPYPADFEFEEAHPNCRCYLTVYEE